MERKTVSFPVVFYNKIKEIADKNHRSVTQQIMYLTEIALKLLETQKEKTK